MNRTLASRARAVFAALAIAVLAGGGAWAAGEEHANGHGGHQGLDGKTFAFQLINFGILLFVLIKFGGKAVNQTLRTRHEQLKSDLAEAATLRADAETRLREQDKRLANLEHEIAALRASMRQEAEHEKSRLVAAAEERARRVKDETAFLLQQQIKEAELRFRREVSEAALKIAEDTLRRSVNPEDERRLASSFVTGIDAPPEGRN